jgi:dynein light intermediate chain
VRVRDEIKMTIQAYQTLYESSIAYGMRKALQAEQNKAEKLLQIASLEKRCQEKEMEIYEEERAIRDKLREEREQKEKSLEAHNAQRADMKVKMAAAQKKLRDALVKEPSKTE